MFGIFVHFISSWTYLELLFKATGSSQQAKSHLISICSISAWQKIPHEALHHDCHCCPKGLWKEIKSDNEGSELSATHFTQLFYRSGLLSPSDASIWAHCGCPESCLRLIWMLPTLWCKFILGLHHSSHKVLYVRKNDDPFFYLCNSDPWKHYTYWNPSPFSFMAITEFIISPTFWWSGDVKNLSLMSGSVAGAEMYIPGCVTRTGYFVFQGILL